MFIKSFRLHNLLFGLAAAVLAAAIVGNLAVIGVRAFGGGDGGDHGGDLRG